MITIIVFILLTITSSPENFISKCTPLALQEQSIYGIPASLKIAQACLETGHGTSKGYNEYQNCYGIRCTDPGHSRHSYCTPYTDSGEIIRLRAYHHIGESFRDHSIYITSGKYATMKSTCGNDPYKWARELQRRGYSADRNYAQKIINIIKRYNLTRFDKK